MGLKSVFVGVAVAASLAQPPAMADAAADLLAKLNESGTCLVLEGPATGYKEYFGAMTSGQCLEEADRKKPLVVYFFGSKDGTSKPWCKVDSSVHDAELRKKIRGLIERRGRDLTLCGM